jgi:hypothetical protein
VGLQALGSAGQFGLDVTPGAVNVVAKQVQFCPISLSLDGHGFLLLVIGQGTRVEAARRNALTLRHMGSARSAYPARVKTKLRMSKWLLLAAVGPLALPAVAAGGDPSEHELHTAQCVAALEAHTDELAAQVKAGQADLQPLLLNELKAGAAFIGDAYVQGERDEARAKGFLNAALEAQKALPKAELAARQVRCAQEGAQLLANADIVSRTVVNRLAQRRMKKLLEG